MRTLMVTIMAVVALLAQSAFAKNIGVLSQDQQPQHLAPAADFIGHMNDVAVPAENRAAEENRVSANTRIWFGSYGGYWPYYSSYYYPYYSSYYPYGYGYYYPYYSYPYRFGYRYWNHSIDRTGNSSQSTVAAERADTPLASMPVVCFASDSAGNFFAEADALSNAIRTQERVNQECTTSSGNCVQNLGCAVATVDR